MTRALALKATVATGLCPPVADGFVDRCGLGKQRDNDGLIGDDRWCEGQNLRRVGV